MRTSINFLTQRVPFTQVANSVLQDSKLSFGAKGLYAYLYSKPIGWNFSYDRIAKETKNGVKAVLALIHELEEWKYLKRLKQGDGRTIYWATYPPDNFVSEPSAENGYLDSGSNYPKRQLAKKGSISNKEVISNKDIVADATGIFNFKEKISKMKVDKDIRMLIIAYYWHFKGWNFDNQEQYQASLKRELRPALSLKGFPIKQIASVMEWCSKEYKIWTLETVFKRISDIGNKNQNDG